MIDMGAPIIPGKEAAGIKLESDIREILRGEDTDFEVEHEIIPGVGDIGVWRYRSPNVDLWTKNNIIWQIMVHGNYEGKVSEKIGIGSTLAELKKSLGNIKFDMDNIFVEGLPGVSFEPEHDDDASSIVEVYVFKPDWTEMT